MSDNFDSLPERKQYLQRWTALKNERASWLTHWQELAEHIHPRRIRTQRTERNRGDKKHSKIINSTATRSSRILSAGMMAGITSPARPWFRLTTPDPELAEYGSARLWLHQVEEAIRAAILKSNLYTCLQSLYGDLGDFGTSAIFVDEDDRTIVRGYHLPIGSYALATGPSARVDTLYREVSMPVGALVRRFGLNAVSEPVKEKYRRGDRESWVDVIHAVEMNPNPKPRLTASVEGMNYRSCWLETAGGDELGLLRKAGYREQPFMAPRWEATGEDVYGASPGMDALGDIRAMQMLEKRKGQAVDKIVNPPMRAPTDLINQTVSLLPGDWNFVSGANGRDSLSPIHEINPQAIAVVGGEIQRHEQRVKEAFFADLWLMLSEAQGDMTAREVAERHEEKMLQLGPVLERLQSELLEPLIDRLFAVLDRRGMLPPPPEDLQGMELKVEYISIMAQAQKLIGTTGVERLGSFVGNMANVVPDIVDKLNVDEMVDDYAGMLGVKPDLVRSDEEVAQIRAAKQAAIQAQRQGEAALRAAQGAKTLSETGLEGDNALNRMLSGLGAPVPAA